MPPIHCSVGPHTISTIHKLNICSTLTAHIVQNDFTDNNTNQNCNTYHFHQPPKTEWYYNLTGTQATTEHNPNLFIVCLLKIFNAKIPPNLLCTVINIGPNNITLPKNRHIGKLALIPDHDTIVHTASVNETTHAVKSNIINDNWTPPKTINHPLN